MVIPWSELIFQMDAHKCSALLKRYSHESGHGHHHQRLGTTALVRRHACEVEFEGNFSLST